MSGVTDLDNDLLLLGIDTFNMKEERWKQLLYFFSFGNSCWNLFSAFVRYYVHPTVPYELEKQMDIKTSDANRWIATLRELWSKEGEDLTKHLNNVDSFRVMNETFAGAPLWFLIGQYVVLFIENDKRCRELCECLIRQARQMKLTLLNQQRTRYMFEFRKKATTDAQTLRELHLVLGVLFKNVGLEKTSLTN